MNEHDFDEDDEDDDLELPPHAIYRETGRGNALVARFDNKQEEEAANNRSSGKDLRSSAPER